MTIQSSYKLAHLNKSRWGPPFFDLNEAKKFFYPGFVESGQSLRSQGLQHMHVELCMCVLMASLSLLLATSSPAPGGVMPNPSSELFAETFLLPQTIACVNLNNTIIAVWHESFKCLLFSPPSCVSSFLFFFFFKSLNQYLLSSVLA